MVDSETERARNGLMNATNKSYHKSAEEIALLMMTRRSKTAAGKNVQAAVLFRMEMTIAIAEELAK